ncbi:helix-turn-helix transcriptional regulator [Kitasatospora sp. RB6PN24]|uniref:helix-turn-helix domain-containing protein n=1 Tax=Kitasatospora humi TaxID=2893891 RepID=UPI001E2B7950|nr:helix-turn-helix transcriptional regulator [Kitasatospora humi]MCC9306367.1 helix-turn-helix transcriptional regulator [Kitasatospora humi]
MPSSRSSSAQAARKAVADRLRELMLDAGLQGQELAALCGWNAAKTSRIINAKTGPSDADIRAWCTACGADDQAADLIARSRQADAMFLEWRRMERNGLRAAQESVRPLYERTQRFRAYAPWLLPGLVQTREYTTAILSAIRDRRGLVDDVPGAVEERMARQHVLHGGGHRFVLLVEESVLRNGLGGPEVMREQLHHLLAVGRLPAVSLGVIPFRPDRERAWPVEGFWIYDTEQVSVELVSGYLTITQPTEIAIYGRVFAELGELAVHGMKARQLINAALDSLG